MGLISIGPWRFLNSGEWHLTEELMLRMVWFEGEGCVTPVWVITEPAPREPQPVVRAPHAARRKDIDESIDGDQDAHGEWHAAA